MNGAQAARVRALVSELRSGRWEQHKGALRGPGNRRCCLGVACEVYIREHPGVRWGPDGSILGAFETLPKPVAEWFGFDWLNPWIADGQFSNSAGTAAGLNDAGATFPEIADRFEALADRAEQGEARGAVA